MPPHPLRVTLAGPLPGERWVSIDRYVESIAALSGRDRLRVRAAPTLPTPGYTRIGAYRARYRLLPALLEATGPGDADLVHVADQALGHLVECFADVPTVVTCHDLMPITMEGHYATAFEAWFDGTLLHRSLDGMHRATRVIAVSEFTAKAVVRELEVSPARVSVVPNILNPAYAPRPDGEPWLAARGIGLPPGPRVLSVGHTRPYKNVERLLAAMGEASLRDASLVRVGAPLTTAQRALATRAGLDGRLVELGHLEPAVLARVYAACDVLAQPSRGEGFGVPVIEAMACALPVVCSDGGALPEVAGDAAVAVGALTAGARGVEELAGALAGVLRDAALASILRRQGLEQAGRFRPEAVLPRLLAAYQSAIEEHHA